MQVDERHGLTFAEGLRAMLRLDADYLLLGEIRDAESAQVALEASTSGRVLMSTLHSRDAFGAVTALRNWNLADHEIATCLSMVIAQRLIRKICPHCRRRGPPTETTVQWLTLLGLPVPKSTWHAVGCSECHDIGYTGRTGVFEVWNLEEEAYQLIAGHTDERKCASRWLQEDTDRYSWTAHSWRSKGSSVSTICVYWAASICPLPVHRRPTYCNRR